MRWERGTENDREDPTNALAATDGEFFEIGWGSSVIVTFGDPSDWVESATLFAGLSKEDPTNWNPATPLHIFNTDSHNAEGR